MWELKQQYLIIADRQVFLRIVIYRSVYLHLFIQYNICSSLLRYDDASAGWTENTSKTSTMDFEKSEDQKIT